MISNLQVTSEEKRSYLKRNMFNTTLFVRTYISSNYISLQHGPLKSPSHVRRQGNISQIGRDMTLVFGPVAGVFSPLNVHRADRSLDLRYDMHIFVSDEAYRRPYALTKLTFAEACPAQLQVPLRIICAACDNRTNITSSTGGIAWQRVRSEPVLPEFTIVL